MNKFLFSLTILSITFSAAHCRAQGFIDDFEDGSASDGTPVTWIVDQQFNGGTHVVENGSYVLTPDRINDYPGNQFSEIDVLPQGLTYGQVTLKSVVRSSAVKNDMFIGLAGRGTATANGKQNTGLWGALRPGGRLTMGVFNTEQNRDQTWNGSYGPTTSSLITTDVNVQLDIFADSAALTAWEVGAPRPLQPQIRIADLPDYVPPTGWVGMFTTQDLVLPMSSVAFRSFEAVPVPEPSTIALLQFVPVGLLSIRRRRN